MYFLAVAIISAFFCYTNWQLVHLVQDGGRQGMTKALRLLLGWSALILALYLPLGIAVLDAMALAGGKGIPASRSLTPHVIISSLAGLVFATLPLLKLWRAARESKPMSFLAVGGHVALAAAGLLVCIAGYKHVEFASGEAGWANIDALHEMNYASDVQCASGVVLVNSPLGLTPTPARYRCPTGLSIGTFAQVPFVPWPDYQEGHSLQLARAMGALRSQASQ